MHRTLILGSRPNCSNYFDPQIKNGHFFLCMVKAPNIGHLSILTSVGFRLEVGGHMNFHVASRGVTINFGFPACEGHVYIVSKLLNFFLARFARLIIIK